VTALLFNPAGLASGAGPRAAGPAPAILDVNGSVPAVRFGETLRAQRSEGGGLLATPGADADLQIDDADILQQLIDTNTNAAVAARTRVAVGADDASSEDSGTTVDGDESLAISWVPLPSSVPELPSVSVTAVAATSATAVADAANDASARDVKAISLTTATPGAARAAVSANPATTTPLVDDGSDASLADASGPRPAPAARAPIAMSVTAAVDQQVSNLLASQSQPLLMAFASGATDATAQKVVATDKTADASPAAPNRQALVDALGERLSVQLNRGSSQATVRLDPPMMGTIEIVIRHDAAGVQVHLSASHGDVLRQLHSIGNALSQDLVQRNHGEVTVHVSESSRDGEGRQRNHQGGSAERDSNPGHALRTADEPERAVAFTLA
jgi:flagellar hook-length control protein FliK